MKPPPTQIFRVMYTALTGLVDSMPQSCGGLYPQAQRPPVPHPTVGSPTLLKKTPPLQLVFIPFIPDQVFYYPIDWTFCLKASSKPILVMDLPSA
ncbi:hypothetical protein DSO57_1034148 [Entomophthora muscae]|uniref:Uncharacterized protein n=1 Tax=Entomophthora muscae TaxID=34485 RepID=A0ACC2TAR6_9FUNG|nr:hypothetical protein DSO57_1034148 [Entomophthora muscae]